MPNWTWTAVDLLEDRGDRADRDVLDGRAELGDRGQVAVAVFRPQAGDPERLLQRREPLISSRKISRSVSVGSGPPLAARTREITSSSRADDQMSSPSACLIWPILSAISRDG
jgi:hypothetical protein